MTLYEALEILTFMIVTEEALRHYGFGKPSAYIDNMGLYIKNHYPWGIHVCIKFENVDRIKRNPNTDLREGVEHGASFILKDNFYVPPGLTKKVPYPPVDLSERYSVKVKGFPFFGVPQIVVFGASPQPS